MSLGASVGSLAASSLGPGAMTNEQKCHQVVVECLNKICEVVCVARTPFPPRSAQQRQRRARFKLNVDELASVRSALASWAVDPHAPLHADVAWACEGNEPVLLERWRVTYSTPAPGTQTPANVKALLRQVCVRIVFLLRSLYSVARVLPAWGLFRASRMGRTATGVAVYDPSTPAVGASFGPALLGRAPDAPPLEFPPDAPIVSQALPAVDTPFGQLCVGVEYRSDAAELAAGEAAGAAASMHLSQAIIPDYAAEPGPEPAPAPAPAPAAAAAAAAAPENPEPEPEPQKPKKKKSGLGAQLEAHDRQSAEEREAEERRLAAQRADLAAQQAALAQQERALEARRQELEQREREQRAAARPRASTGVPIPRHPGRRGLGTHVGSLPVAIPGAQAQPPPAASLPAPALTRGTSRSLEDNPGGALAAPAPYGYGNVPLSSSASSSSPGIRATGGGGGGGGGGRPRSSSASPAPSGGGGGASSGLDWARARASSGASAFASSPPPPGMPQSLSDSTPPFASEAASSLLASSPFSVGAGFAAASPPFAAPATTALGSSPQPTFLGAAGGGATGPAATPPAAPPAAAWTRPWGTASASSGGRAASAASAASDSGVGLPFAMDMEDDDELDLGGVGLGGPEPEQPDNSFLAAAEQAAPLDGELCTVDSFADDLEQFKALRDTLSGQDVG